MEMDILHDGENNGAVWKYILVLPQENYVLGVGLSCHIVPTDKTSYNWNSIFQLINL